MCFNAAKYAAGGQLGVILNKIKNTETLDNIFDILQKYSIETLGVIPTDDTLSKNPVERESSIIQNAIKQFYFRLNLPQKRI